MSIPLRQSARIAHYLLKQKVKDMGIGDPKVLQRNELVANLTVYDLQELAARFQGVESPHKMKLATAGCPRNCSEAYVKDLGAVAIEACAFSRQLYCARRPHKKRDSKVVFQTLDRPADRRRIDQQAPRRRDKATAFDNPDENLDSAHVCGHTDLSPAEDC